MKESEIRPQALFNRYLELAEDDIRRYFADRAAFVIVECPACGTADGDLAFVKHGFAYRLCGVCGSMYLNPRPAAEVIDRYYRDSAAVKFWETNFFKETADARRMRMFRPRAALVAAWADRLDIRGVCADIGAGYGIFLEEMGALAVFSEVIGVEPAPNLAAVCRERGFRVVEKPVERVEPGELLAAFATAFEVLEHVSSPAQFLRAIGRLLSPGGALLLTTLTVSGFDIIELWDHSKSVHPPHHINLLSTDGLRILVDRSGFDLIDLSTPGQLDVDIVENMLAEHPAVPVSRFARSLLRQPGEVKEAFQAFLRTHRLSSHVQVVARRRQ